MPRADLPFDDAFLEYARKALAVAGLEPDRDWLTVQPVNLTILDAISEQRFYYDAARQAVPKSEAHWEQAAFMQPALRAAIWDLQWGAITSFREFEFLYSRLLGEHSRRVLPMLFSAACWSPSLDGEFAARLLDTLSFDVRANTHP